jgi:hypothetical protein
LKTTPNCTIEKLGVVCGCNYDHVTWKLIYLHKEEGNNTLDLTGLVRISALLADRIKLIKEKHAGGCTDVVEKSTKASIGLPQITSYQHIVSDHEKRQRQRLSDGLRKRCFPITRWTGKEHSVPGLQPMGSKNI